MMILLIALDMDLVIFIALALKLLLQELLYLLAMITTVNRAMLMEGLILVGFSQMTHYGMVNSAFLVITVVTELVSHGFSIKCPSV